MPAEQLTSDDYPYGRQPPAVLRVRDLQPTRAPLMPRLWPLLLRVGAVSLVAFLIVATPIGIVGYRASRQAAMIAELEQLGCRVSYSFDRTNDSALDTLQGLFGANSFADVSGVEIDSIPPQEAARVVEICRHFPHLSSFTIVSNAFRFDQIASWQHLDGLTTLGISSTNLTDDDLARIARMPNLIHLALTSPRITDKGIHHLASLPQLTNLELHSVQLTGGVPANPGGFPLVEYLAIYDAPRLNDQAIINLGPLPALTTLNLGQTQIGDAAIAHIANATKLNTVILNQTQITDAALKSLSKCPSLVTVDVADTAVTDAGVAHLALCSALSNLDLSGTRVTGKDFGFLPRNEMSLNMDRTPASDEAVPELLQISGLGLSLQDTKISGTTFAQRPAGGGPGTVDLSGAALTPQGFAALAKASIPELKLSRTSLNDQQLMLFVGNDAINSLDVSQTKVTANGLIAFYEARKQRLESAKRPESLYVISSFANIAEQYFPQDPVAMPDESAEQSPDQEPAQPPQQPPM
jgi:hypothetical protein